MSTTKRQMGGQSVSEEQEAVVQHVLANRITVTDAGAGAGKTQTTIATVFEILQQSPEASIYQFALITFTNKAADELKMRLAKALFELESKAMDATVRQRWASVREQLGNAYVGTIHGFCKQILTTFGYSAEVAHLSDLDFAGGLLYEAVEDAINEVVLGTSGNPLRRELCGRWRIDHLSKLVRAIHQDMRNSGLNPKAVEDATKEQPRDANDAGYDFRAALAELVAEVHGRYEKLKREGQKLDSTDLLMLTRDALSGNDGAVIVRKLTSRYRYLFIDEFQDTDPVQLEIVECLEPQLTKVLLVGDGKQSIYGFRGANQSLESLAWKKMGRAPLRLSMSRRPTNQLLKAYNELFDSMGDRYPELRQPLQPFEEPLQATNGLPPITLLNAGSSEIQAGIDRTAKAIRGLNTKMLDIRTKEGARTRPLQLGDIALLFRRNDDLNAYETGLRAAGIDVRIETGSQFFRRPEILGAYRLLRFMLDYPNDLATLHALETLYLRNLDLNDTVRSYLWYGRNEGHELTDKFEEKFPEYATKFRTLRSMMKTDTVSELLGRMDEMLELRKFHETRGDLDGAEGLERLREMARSLTDSEQALNVTAFTRHLARKISDDAEGPEIVISEDGPEVPPPYVRLMTVHSAKGLEFPVVILPQMHNRVTGAGSSMFIADDDQGLDVNVRELDEQIQTRSPAFWARSKLEKSTALFEEMRIFYVAITRAQNHVVLIGADTGTLHSPNERVYSWQDEVLKTRGRLTNLSCRFE